VRDIHTRQVVVPGKTHIAFYAHDPDCMYVTFPSGVSTSVVKSGGDWAQLAKWIDYAKNKTWADFDH